jgi:hypothetical protein
MGMFDYIRTEIQLPDFDGDIKVTEFQTKDLKNSLSTYVISQNGELYKEEWEYIWIPDDTRLFKGYIQQIPNSYRRIYLDFHGDITFYSGDFQRRPTWRDYHARFTEGRLTKIWYTDTAY